MSRTAKFFYLELSLIVAVKYSNFSDNAVSGVYHCILINVDNAYHLEKSMQFISKGKVSVMNISLTKQEKSW